MHFPSLCAVSWWFHTVTEMSFILVGPGMPFSFHQSQYRLLIVTDLISLSIWSLNLKQISFKISEKPSCHLLLPSKLPQQHLSQDSPENYNSEPTLLDRMRAFPLIGLDYYVSLKVSFRTRIFKKSVKIDDARSIWEEPTMHFLKF